MKQTNLAVARILALVSLLAASNALAQTQALGNTDYSVGVTTSVILCVPADASRKTLWIENPATATNNLAYCVSVAGASCTPAIATAGSTTLTPGGVSNFSYGSAPIGPVYCVCSAAGPCPATIRSGK